jgi:hypothetical protein
MTFALTHQSDGINKLVFDAVVMLGIHMDLDMVDLELQPGCFKDMTANKSGRIRRNKGLCRWRRCRAVARLRDYGQWLH